MRTKGQSTVEYILVVTAIIGVVIIVSKGTFSQKVGNTLEGAVNSMDSLGGTLKDSHSGDIPPTTPMVTLDPTANADDPNAAGFKATPFVESFQHCPGSSGMNPDPLCGTGGDHSGCCS